MSWAYIDDQSTFHAKVLSAGNAAWGACVRMIAWSMSHLTDGKVPGHVAKLIASDEEIATLVKSRLLDTHESGVVIHDFLEWNKSAKQIRKERAERSKSGKAGGLASGKRRKQTPSKRQANAEALACGLVPTMLNPSPSPSPSPEREREDPCEPAAPVAEPVTRVRAKRPPAKANDGDHDALIDCYAKAFSRAKGGKPTITNRTGKAAKDLLRAMPLERAKATVRAAFESGWFVDNLGGELWHVANSPNKYLAPDTAPPPDPEPTEPQTRENFDAAMADIERLAEESTL